MFYGSDEIDQNPKGSISIIEISKRPAKSRVNTLYFTKSNKYYEENGVRLNGPEKGNLESLVSLILNRSTSELRVIKLHWLLFRKIMLLLASI